MSSGAAPAVRAHRRHGIVVDARSVARLAWPALAVAVVVLLVVVSWNTWGDLAHDTGYDLVAAQRIADGQAPYVDFTYIYGPLGVALLAGVYAVVGGSLGAAVALGLVLTASALVLTYALARELTARDGASLAVILTAGAALGTGNISFVMAHSLSAPTAVVLALGALLAAAHATRTKGRAPFAVAGVLAGLVALTRPEFTLAIDGALGLWLVLRVVQASGDRRARIGDAGLCLGLAAAVPLIVYGVFATQMSGRSLLSDNLFPSEQLRAGGSTVLRSSAPLTAASFAHLALWLLVAVAAAGVLVAAATAFERRARDWRRPLAIVCVLALGLLLVVLAANPEAVRSRVEWGYHWIPAGALVALIALVWMGRRKGHVWAPREQVALLCTAFLAVLAAKTYAAFDPHPNPAFPQFATYAMPFAAIWLAWLALEVLPRGNGAVRMASLAVLAGLALISVTLVLHDARAETFTVSGPHGTIAASPAQGPAYQGALDAIVARTKPGDPVLLAPQLTALYTLSGRTDPLPELSLLPGALPTPASEEAAIARMRDVDVAVIDRRPLTEYGHGRFGTTFDTRIAAWLRSNFHRTATFAGAGPSAATLDLWERTTT